MTDVVAGPLRFFADFDSGNLQDASLNNNDEDQHRPSSSGSDNNKDEQGYKLSADGGVEFFLKVSPDCAGTSGELSAYRSWFFFGVTYVGPPDLPETTSEASSAAGRRGRTNPTSSTGLRRGGGQAGSSRRSFKATFTITNFSAVNRMFDFDNRPVFRREESEVWARLPTCATQRYYDPKGCPMPDPLSSSNQTSGAASHHGGTSGRRHSTSATSSSSCSYYDAPHGGASSGTKRSGPRGAVIDKTSAANGNNSFQPKKWTKSLSESTMTLSWSHTFSFQGETVYFATNFPYPYAYQCRLVDKWEATFGGELRNVVATATNGGNSPSGTEVCKEEDCATDGTDKQSSVKASVKGQGGALPRPPPAPPTAPAAAPPHSPLHGRRASNNVQTPLSNVARVSRRAASDGGASASAGGETKSSTSSADGDGDSGGGVYFVKETLCHSLGSRRVDLLTITGRNGIPTAAGATTADDDEGDNAREEAGLREPPISGSFPLRHGGTKRPFLFPDKRTVLITARVHPGETPASHVLHGVLEFLLSQVDPRAVLLRKRFVFKVVPMLNPDGVALGHYRTDSRGVNLNRHYDAPDFSLHPTIYATKELFLSLANTGRLVLYLDLHAHASKRACFVFGNAWDDMKTHLSNLLFPKLVALNTTHFHFPSCDFSSKSMVSKETNKGEATKEGTGRVALAQRSGLVHCYTLEASYNMGLPAVGGSPASSLAPLPRGVPSSQDFAAASDYVTSASAGASCGRRGSSGILSSSFLSGSPSSSTTSGAGNSAGGKYSPLTYHDVGRALLVALLDLHKLNTHSRLPNSKFGSLGGVRASLEKKVNLLVDNVRRIEEATTGNGSSNGGSSSVSLGGGGMDGLSSSSTVGSSLLSSFSSTSSGGGSGTGGVVGIVVSSNKFGSTLTSVSTGQLGRPPRRRQSTTSSSSSVSTSAEACFRRRAAIEAVAASLSLPLMNLPTARVDNIAINSCTGNENDRSDAGGGRSDADGGGDEGGSTLLSPTAWQRGRGFVHTAHLQQQKQQ